MLLRLLSWIFQPVYIILIALALVAYLKRDLLVDYIPPLQQANTDQTIQLVEKQTAAIEKKRQSLQEITLPPTEYLPKVNEEPEPVVETLLEEKVAEVSDLKTEQQPEEIESVIAAADPIQTNNVVISEVAQNIDTTQQNDHLLTVDVATEQAVEASEDTSSNEALTPKPSNTIDNQVPIDESVTEPVIAVTEPISVSEINSPDDVNDKSEVIEEDKESTVVPAVEQAAENLAVADEVDEPANQDKSSPDENGVSIEKRQDDELQHLWYLARYAAWQKRFDDAVNLYLDLIKTYPQHADGYGELGNVYLLIGDVRSAIAYYQQAVAILEKDGQIGAVWHLKRVIEELQYDLNTN